MTTETTSEEAFEDRVVPAPPFDESFIQLEFPDTVLVAGEKYRFKINIPSERAVNLYPSVVNGTIYAPDQDGFLTLKPTSAPSSCVLLYEYLSDSSQLRYGQRCFTVVSSDTVEKTVSR